MAKAKLRKINEKGKIPGILQPWRIPGVPDDQVRVVYKPSPESTYDLIVRQDADIFKALADV